MNEQSHHGGSGWIMPGLAVVLLSAKLSADFWPQLTSLATTVRNQSESQFASEEEPPPEPPTEPVSTTPTDAPGAAPIMIGQPPGSRHRQCHLR